MNWIIIFLVVCAGAAYVVWPLRRNALENHDIEYSMSEAAPVDAQEALQQLDFDLSMGKIDDIEYRQSRAQLTTEIVDEGVVPTPPSSDDADMEAEILIARARRRKRETPIAKTPIAETATTEMPITNWTCGECGREMSDADRFCASCGAARVAETADI